MLIHDTVRPDWKFHINLSQVVSAYIHKDDSGNHHRIEMANCEYFDVTVKEYDEIVAYLDKED
jgi:hypothetical protein